MLLRESGRKANQTFNLTVVTGAEGLVGVEHEAELLDVAKAVFEGDQAALKIMRQRTEPVLGPQGMVDAIAVDAIILMADW